MPRRVLVIEDSNEDYTAILRAFERASADVDISRSETGDEALEKLREVALGGKFAQLPQLILLDLNLPGSDGREILSEIKSDESLKMIPVVVLTTSTNPRDVADCYRKGVSGYCTKGGGRTQFDATIRAIQTFWLETAVLPDWAKPR